MTAEVVELNAITRLDIPADRVLRGAIDADLKQVLIVGYDQEDDYYFASSLADGAEVLWLLEVMKRRLLREGDPE